MALPDWIRQSPENPAKFIIDQDLAYGYALADLGVEQIDQYWLEIAYVFIKLDATFAIAQAGLDPRFDKEKPQSLQLVIRGSAESKERFKQAGKPEGNAASFIRAHGDNAWRFIDKEARELYRKQRGFVPT